jgi:hypothetical protein
MDRCRLFLVCAQQAVLIELPWRWH